jgi:hypothetical protein
MTLADIPVKDMDNGQLLQAMCIWYSRYQKLGTDYLKYQKCYEEASKRLKEALDE